MANFFGGLGNDVFVGGNAADLFTSGGGGDDNFRGQQGADVFEFGVDFNALDQVDGGAGNDTLRVTGNHIGGNAVFFASTTMKNVETIQLNGGFNYDFTMDEGNVAAGQTLTVDNSVVGAGVGSLRFDGSHETDGRFSVLGSVGDDLLIGGSLDDKLYGGTGNDNILGLKGRDIIRGDNGNDIITGGAAGDSITAGNGADMLVYNPVSDSTSVDFDTVRGFNFAGTDVFQLPVAVVAVNPAIGVGTLSTATFDADLTAAVNGGNLGPNSAVLFTPNGGGLNGTVFMVVDANGLAGYQAGADYVMQLVASSNIGAFNVADFI